MEKPTTDKPPGDAPDSGTELELRVPVPREVALRRGAMRQRLLRIVGAVAVAGVLYVTVFRSRGGHIDEAVVDGTVTEVHAVDGEYLSVRFKYQAGGSERVGRGVLRRREFDGLQPGRRMPVRYSEAAPQDGRLEDQPSEPDDGSPHPVSVVLWIVVGTLMFVVFEARLRLERRLLRSGVPVRGEVVSLTHVLGRDRNNPKANLNYRFRTRSGTVLDGKSVVFLKGTFHLNPGDPLTILYDTEYPMLNIPFIACYSAAVRMPTG
jgi:hypothetical protein